MPGDKPGYPQHMTDAPAQTDRPKRPDLSAGLIAAEAMALVDAEGLDALSFRALARRLHCQAMSLYHYFPSKAHLLEAMVNICLAETPPPEGAGPARARLRAFCHRYRATALRHPGFAPVFLTHRLSHREGLDWLERCLALFDGLAIPDREKATLFRTIGYFIMGAALDESIGYAKGQPAAHPVPRETAAREFPLISAMSRFWGPEHRDHFFEAGLERMLAAIDRAEAARPPAPPEGTG